MLQRQKLKIDAAKVQAKIKIIQGASAFIHCLQSETARVKEKWLMPTAVDVDESSSVRFLLLFF